MQCPITVVDKLVGRLGATWIPELNFGIWWLAVECCLYTFYRSWFTAYWSLILNGFNFHIPVDFGSNVLFHQFFFVYNPGNNRNSIETSWFSLWYMRVHWLKRLPWNLDTWKLMLPPPVLAQSAFALPKTPYTQVRLLECWSIFVFRWF